jgi:hypothetical protein
MGKKQKSTKGEGIGVGLFGSMSSMNLAALPTNYCQIKKQQDGKNKNF